MTLMDTAQLLGNVGDFIGAIAIVVTLIYLVLQLRQNTNALHAHVRQGILAASQAELLATIDNPDLILSMIKTGPLSLEEAVKYSFWLSAAFRTRQFAWLQYQDGAIDEPQWRTERIVLQRILRRPINRAWWVSAGRELFVAEFVAFVDDLIRELPASNDALEPLFSWANR